MKKTFIILGAFILVLVLVFLYKRNDMPSEDTISQTNRDVVEVDPPDTNVMPANPASANCEENDGVVEIITETDGSQFGLCRFEDYACEEWAFFNGECAVVEDSENIRQALVDKGLDLTDMKVVIRNHLGKYIEASVIPISAEAGGGYVFAVKTDEGIEILADGNGSIMCSSFQEYPDFPSYLVSECIDESGEIVLR